MLKHRFLVILSVMGVLVVVVTAYHFRVRWQPDRLTSVTEGEIVTAQLGSQILQVEVVSSPATITQGLSGRQVLVTDGMLFLLGRPSFPQFWMKDMMFDLDLIWLLDNQVVDITANVPHPKPGTPDSELPIYPAAVPANQVLEVAAGSATNWGIMVGDQLKIR